MKRGAEILWPNIVLCQGALVVHVISSVLVPAASFYSSVTELIAVSPELSMTAQVNKFVLCKTRPFKKKIHISIMNQQHLL